MLGACVYIYIYIYIEREREREREWEREMLCICISHSYPLEAFLGVNCACLLRGWFLRKYILVVALAFLLRTTLHFLCSTSSSCSHVSSDLVARLDYPSSGLSPAPRDRSFGVVASEPAPSISNLHRSSIILIQIFFSYRFFDHGRIVVLICFEQFACLLIPFSRNLQIPVTVIQHSLKIKKHQRKNHLYYE